MSGAWTTISAIAAGALCSAAVVTGARRYFRWIQQDHYLPPGRASWSFARMAPWAIAYVPTGCLASLHGCRVHVDYHGCIADQWPQRLMWVQNLDLNEYGEANNIVILYPQAKGDSRTGTGCWNWGFPKDDTLFDTKMSAQLLTVMNMLDELPRTLELAQELPFGEGPPSSRAPVVVRGRSGNTGSKEVRLDEDGYQKGVDVDLQVMSLSS
mmetsp:Transcript_73538/g.239325  ORF Transcript_73538/g.239325 Transcript_73538/m.239325 type:complete len:211 (-) Transcript_73538:71-703(-)